MVNGDVRVFLEREYDRIGAALVENEAMGEGRVALYLGVWSAAVAGVGVMLSSTDAPAPAVATAAVSGLVVVATLGMVTTARICTRNYRTDEFVDSLSRIRRLLQPGDAETAARTLPWKRTLTKSCRPTLLHAGLLHVVCLANAALPVLAIIASQRDRAPFLSLAAAMTATLLLQLVVISRFNAREWVKRGEKGAQFLKDYPAAGDEPTAHGQLRGAA